MTAAAEVVAVTSRVAFLAQPSGEMTAHHEASVASFPFSCVTPGWRSLSLRVGEGVTMSDTRIARGEASATFRRLAPRGISAVPGGTSRLAARIGRNLAPGPALQASSILLAAFRGDQRLDDALVAVIGYGPGLTPSGDDVLVGLFAGLDLSAETQKRWRLRTAFASLEAIVPQRTTSVSAAILVAAAVGHYAGVIADVCASAAWRTPAQLDAALARLSAVGSSTGRDVIAGLALAAIVSDAHAGITT